MPTWLDKRADSLSQAEGRGFDSRFPLQSILLSAMARAADRLKFAAEWPIAGLMRELTERKTYGELELYRQLL